MNDDGMRTVYDDGEIKVISNDVDIEIYSMINSNSNGDYIWFTVAELNAIHAAVFPEKHDAAQASEKIETVKRTCGGCRYFDDVDCYVDPDTYPTWDVRPGCRFWEAK